MCKTVEVARILDISESLINTKNLRNSALLAKSMSIMEKLRPPEELLSLPEFSTAMKKSTSLESLNSSSYSSNPDEEPTTEEKLLDDIENLIVAVKVIDDDNRSTNYVTDDDDPDNDDDDAGLIERGPVRPQLHLLHSSRTSPYIERASCTLTTTASTTSTTSATTRSLLVANNNENSTDYDMSAKEILTDWEYRQKIDMCLEKLSDMSQELSPIDNSLLPADSELCSGASAYSFQQSMLTPNSQQSHHHNHEWQTNKQTPPSITLDDPNESTLLEILSRGGFQSALTPEHRCATVAATTSDADGPDSPTSACQNNINNNNNGGNNCATLSRPESRASSRAQSPGSVNGATGNSGLLNVLSSPMGSPQISPQSNFRSCPCPSSSSSSGQSYCDRPSPANYQNPLDHHLEEQLGDHMMSRMPGATIWRESFESSETLVNGSSSSSSSSKLQLQLVDELIRGDMCGGCRNNHQRYHQSGGQIITTSNYPVTTTASCLDNAGGGTEDSDDLTSTLLRFVGGERTLDPVQGRLELSQSSTSGYNSAGSSSNSSEMRRPVLCDGNCVVSGTVEQQQQVTNSFAGSLRRRGSNRQQQQQQQIYLQQPCNVNPNAMDNNLQFSTTSIDLIGMKNGNSWSQSYGKSGNTKKSPTMSNIVTNNFHGFQMPKIVPNFQTKRSNGSSKTVAVPSNNVTVWSSSSRQTIDHRNERIITPWPSLNLPSTRSSERLKELTEPREVEQAMRSLLKRPLEQLAKADEDGDTMLMCLVGNPVELRKKLSYLAPLVERLGTIDGALSMMNARGDDALYLAATNCPESAYVTGYLAAAFLQKNIDIGQRLYRSRGDTLVHALAAKGDTYSEVLAELLSLRTPQQNSVFDLSKRNYDGRTALHVAAESHETILESDAKTMTIGTVRLLLDNGAEPTTREIRCGDTALHIAVSLSCDPTLVKVLLSGKGRDAVNVVNYNGNTPLHLAASMSARTSLERQSEICWHLVNAGGRSNVTNRQGKTPLALVSAERKEALKRVLHKKT